MASSLLFNRAIVINVFVPPSLIPYYPYTRVQVPTNDTRISRAPSHTGLDGKLHIIYYDSGVETGLNVTDAFAGGPFGLGISETIRAAYCSVTAN
jgi:hypothetical protein